jgi:hypothetical protein
MRRSQLLFHPEISARIARCSPLSSVDQGMQSKSECIKQALRDGDWVAALRLASRFHDRSSDTAMFKRGFDAYQHPGFYRQLGKDPNQLVAAAVIRLWRRFGSAN